MVYCGKASQNCQNCRTRRIKCDKVRPQCTQCVRVGKKCPGYRDQLSLMFRDESNKVIQKAHAQWGGVPDFDSGEASGSSPTSSSPDGSSVRSRGSIAESYSSTSPVSPDGSRGVMRVPKEVPTPTVDRAVQFYLEHYVIGLPDEAKFGHELQRESWVFSPTTRDIMAAVGFAGLSHLSGDKSLMVLARQQYGLALRSIAAALHNVQGLDKDVYVRAVVMLGIYEVVRGEEKPTEGAQIHIMGGAALMKSILPVFQSSAEGIRGLLQMCYSMVATVTCSVQQWSTEPNVMIPTDPVPSMAEGVLPPAFYGLIGLGSSMATPHDIPAAELLNVIARFVQLAGFVRSRLLKDGQPETFEIIRQALEIEQQLDAWERRQEGYWAVTEERMDPGFFPPDAVFEGSYHVYTDMWTARVWTNYRFARILVNQLLLESVDRFPSSSLSLVPPIQQRDSLDAIKRVARDTLVSVPTHYRHPKLERKHREYFEKTTGGAGIGAAQVPTLIFQLKVAGAAPGIPPAYYDWALKMIRTIFADTGMLQAKRLGDLLAKVKEVPRTMIFVKWEDEEGAEH